MDLSRMFPKAQLDGMHARLLEVASGLGVSITPRDHAPSTRPALAISEYARREGRLDAWREAAMDAHWRDGRDIEDPTVLRELATGAGLDADEALAFVGTADALLAGQRSEAQRWGVTGIPTWFLLPEGWRPDAPRAATGPQPVRVVGCQPAEVVERAAQMAGARRRAGIG